MTFHGNVQSCILGNSFRTLNPKYFHVQTESSRKELSIFYSPCRGENFKYVYFLTTLTEILKEILTNPKVKTLAYFIRSTPLFEL